MLKACPFCGGEAGLGTGQDRDAGEYWFVNCTDCMASTNVTLYNLLPATKAEAIAAWNTRALPEPAADLVEVVARAIWNSNFHPSDVASGEAQRRIADWPEDWSKAKRQARAAILALKDKHNG